MKIFTIVSIALLTFAAFQVNKHFFKTEETYYARLAKIAEHVNSLNTTWKAATPNRFSTLTLEQVKAMMGTKMDKEFNFPANNYEGVTAPDSFDSRTQWPKCSSISEIRDQANCGSCWAFGAVTSFSDRICIQSGQTTQTRVSAEDLNDCCFSCGQGCNGGYPGSAWQYFITTGVVSGDLYGDTVNCQGYTLPPCAHHVAPSPGYPACPASVATPTCKKQCMSNPSITYSQNLNKLKTTYGVKGETSMMNELSAHGPFEVAFTVYEDFLTYTSGVYKHTSGQALGGHAVKVLGYGTTSNNVKYWIINNSWNTTWGNQGYFWILRGVNECGIESQGVAGN